MPAGFLVVETFPHNRSDDAVVSCASGITIGLDRSHDGLGPGCLVERTYRRYERYGATGRAIPSRWVFSSGHKKRCRYLPATWLSFRSSGLGSGGAAVALPCLSHVSAKVALGVASFLFGAYALKTMAPALSHSMWGCQPGLIFRRRCSHCWRQIEKGQSVSGWVPIATAEQRRFQAFLEGKHDG